VSDEAGHPESLPAALEARLNTILAEHAVPGAAIAVRSGGRSWLHLHGRRSIGGAQGVTPRTAFDVGSCSKAYAAVAAALLVQDGAIRWDDSIHTALPELEMYDSWITRNLSYRDLLSNRVGVARQLPLESFANEEIPVLDILSRMRHARPAGPFRGAYGYWNPGFMAVAAAVARISGMAYEDFLRDRLFRPLGMLDSASGRNVDALPDTARGHVIEDGAPQTFDEPRFVNYQGAAGVYSSGRDALTWLRFHLGEFPDVLRPELLAELHLAHIPLKREERKLIHAPEESGWCSYCMGWTRGMIGDHQIVQHAGEMFGWRAHVAFLPELHLGVSAYINVDRPIHHAICYTVLEMLVTGEARDWVVAAQADQQRTSGNLRALIDGAIADAAGQPCPVPFEAFAGVYDHPGLGKVFVRMDGEHLGISYETGRIWDAGLVHVGGGVFDMRFRHKAIVSYWPVTPKIRFHVSDGSVASLSDVFGSNFVRIADAPATAGRS